MDRDSLVYQAKLAEQAERFDEMVEHMKAVAQQPVELTVEERNLLSVAYKNVIGSRRASWRVISSIEQKGEQDRLPLIRGYKTKIENELEEIAKQKSSERERVSSYSFQANRQLVQKVMEQREIIQNRQEYLAKEKIAAAQEISRSKAKTDVLEKRKRLERAKILAENEIKQEDKFNYIIKR